jgi:uncharacterized protein (TIGR02271 family)
MTTHTVTAMFDSRAEAERAADSLVSQLGLSRSAIRVDADAGTTTGSATGTGGKGLMASLADLFLPDADRHTYAEGMRRGGALLSVRAEEAQMERVADVLETAGAVDLDTREAEWRQSGWGGHAGAAAGTGATVGAAASGTQTGVAAMPATGTTAGRATGGAATGREESIPMAEETLRVGKRVASAGRVRVRSFVVETPVEEQVQLRQEHVRVERRPADSPGIAGEDLFRERVIEAEQSVEEAVVQKETRVTGEVVVNKDSTEHTETIRDTVRRTDVEVDEDSAANTNTTGARRPGKAS